MSSFTTILAATLLATAFGASCASDDDGPATTEIVVAGAPLTIVGPGLGDAGDGSIIVTGTLSNVTDRTIEVVSATSSVGAASFRSETGAALSSIIIEPGADLALGLGGTQLVLDADLSEVDAADITLELDIQDEFTFRATS